MNEKPETIMEREEEFKLVIDYMREIMQQAQFAAVNIAIAANLVSRSFGRDSELGKTLNKLASESSNANKRVEELSRIAIEGINSFDYRSFKKKLEIDPKTLRKIEETFSLIMADSEKAMNILKSLNLKTTNK
ncbi:MAG: hypothetical protein GF315_12910 [candidate division Zixibacteria bacterium]|nr:hypothetical protein [candidate division Zixibacteria bacterium]